MEDPVDVVITMAGGERAAVKIARGWKLDYEKEKLFFTVRNFDELYATLIRICCFVPGLDWLRKKLG